MCLATLPKLLNQNLRDLLDRWSGRDEIFARKSGHDRSTAILFCQ